MGKFSDAMKEINSTAKPSEEKPDPRDEKVWAFEEWAEEFENRHGIKPKRIDPTDVTKAWFKKKFVR